MTAPREPDSTAALRPTSNTRDCWSWLVGKTVIGVLFGALPSSRPDIARGCTTLVLDNGEGLTVSSKGTFWPETREDVERAARRKQQELERTSGEIRDVLALAGAHAQT